MDRETSFDVLKNPSDESHPAKAHSSELTRLLGEIDNSVRRLSELTRHDAEQEFPSGVKPPFEVWVRQEYSRRRQREKFFPAETLLGEPGWDLLLDLAIQKCANRVISVTSACIASQVPTTTALRWIAILEQGGFVQRSIDPTDKRRTLVTITDSALDRLRAYYESLP